MQKTYILLIVTLIVAIIFIMQNMAPIPIQLFFWSFEAPTAILLIITFILGSLTGILVSLPSIYKHKKALSELKKNLSEKEQESKETTNPSISSRNE